MLTTKSWAQSLNLSVAATAPAVKNYSRRCRRTARQIAVRSIILHGVVAVAFKVNPEAIIDWFREQRIWRSVTPGERAFLTSPSRTSHDRLRFTWHKEAEWTLLWAIGKIQSLGLPTTECDTRRLVDEIIPPLGTDISDFVSTAKTREPGVLLAEDDRTYQMWCHAQEARRTGQLPSDLNWSVLYERRYALEWLDNGQSWDDITCDA